MDIFDQLVGTIEAPAKPRRFVFVLLEEFTMLCFSAAVESLRIANRMSGRDWRVKRRADKRVMLLCCGH